jgi:hypothetical protein
MTQFKRLDLAMGKPASRAKGWRRAGQCVTHLCLNMACVETILSSTLKFRVPRIAHAGPSTSFWRTLRAFRGRCFSLPHKDLATTVHHTYESRSSVRSWQDPGLCCTSTYCVLVGSLIYSIHTVSNSLAVVIVASRYDTSHVCVRKPT